ncbi:MAG: inorganic phosphate transporter [Chitinophagales bacterium]|jgi:PiT family inorganic phosphate transporter|nr:inorganic phosphate transporter [Chitinophagales bacterium]
MEFLPAFNAMSLWYQGLFVVCILSIIIFEMVNGFHDTANAVATVIYTKTLKPIVAVVLSGSLNFLGVMVSVYFFGMKVAVSIVKLLPLSQMADTPLGENIALVLAVIISAIIWNLGTWYFGIPSSSSHTMIGAILGSGLGYQFIHQSTGVNWSKAAEIGASLILSPAFGFSLAIFLVFIVFKIMRQKNLFKESQDDPPFYIKVILILTCSLVSFFHGSNDGQKGLGVVMIILLTFFPMYFALNADFGDKNTIMHLDKISSILSKNAQSSPLEKEFIATLSTIEELKADISAQSDTTVALKFKNRNRVQSLVKSLSTITKDPEFLPNEKSRKDLKEELSQMKHYIEFAPMWSLVMIALALGIGTMIGWKRIVVTIGEKIGKTHLTFGQGAVSEVVAASTIGLSTSLGLPVSTTHVLSSAIAGSMVAKGGVKNLQKGTIKSIALAWVLTLPVSIALGFLLFILFRLLLA